MKINSKVYKPSKPTNPMEEEKRLILQVKENKNKQKRITIPNKSDIKHNDYVEVKKHE